MTTNELRVLEIVWNWGGEASVDIIARVAGVSIDYARLICESLGKENCIEILGSKLCKIKSKGKLAVVQKTGQVPRRIVVPEGKSKFGLGKDKKGRIILNYG